jgi:hypothetical protein
MDAVRSCGGRPTIGREQPSVDGDTWDPPSVETAYRSDKVSGAGFVAELAQDRPQLILGVARLL